MSRRIVTSAARLLACFIVPALTVVAHADEKAEKKQDEAKPAASSGAAESKQSKFGDESLIDSDRWHYEVSQYLWMSGVKSKVAIGDTTSEMDAKFGDLLDVLKFAGTIHAEARKGRWGIFSDLMYIKLGDATEKRVGDGLKSLNIDVKVDFEQTLAEVGGFYRFGADRCAFDLLGGARYMYIGTDVDVGPLGVGVDKEWLDPFVGGRLVTMLSDRWAFTLRADAGGFGAGTDLTWNAVVMLRYRMTKHSELGFGYRHMDVGAGNGNGSFDSTTSGPIIGMGFRF